MTRKEWMIDKMFTVSERFLYHREKAGADDPFISETAKKMCEIELWEMWVLTQEL